MSDKDDGFVEAKGGTDSTWDRTGVLQGTYLRMETEVGPNDSNMYHIKTETETVGVWGSAVLDTKFSEIPVGAEVRLEALEKKTNPKSGREFQDYSVKYKKTAVNETFPDAEQV